MGILERLKRKYFASLENDVCSNDVDAASSPIALSGLWPVASVLASGIALSCVVLILENFAKKHQSKYSIPHATELPSKSAKPEEEPRYCKNLTRVRF